MMGNNDLYGLNGGEFTINEFILYALNQSAITCSKLTIETLEQEVKYVQS